MHLKSLTLKGFKSFASATTLEFEPGVTAVVGPNGSGKSNVVDALAWVMGEQGAKSLRGAKMEDVVFAGTSGRSPLGRAEVSLTIDNSDGALPIDYSEVTVSRIMFRSGGSEYAINGSACRLLDVQELLSDSGIGREMHVIVGQGQLDSILHATPEERRGFIDEAAGVLKHRKRKEKSQRKLASLDEKLSRLNDLNVELRKQLKPLGRQADVARRASVIAADVRDARLRLLAEDYVLGGEALQREIADEEALLHKRSELQAQLLAAHSREASLTAEASASEPLEQQAQLLWFRMSQVTERFRSLASVARERLANLDQDEDSQGQPGRDAERMDDEAAALEHESEELGRSAEAARGQLSRATLARTAAEDVLEEQESALERARRDRAAAREAGLRLTALLEQARQAVADRERNLARVQDLVDRTEGRLVATAQESGQPTDEPDQPTQEDLAHLQEAEERTRSLRTQSRTRVSEARERLSAAEQDAARSVARVEALTLALQSHDPDTLTTAEEHANGPLGRLADLVHAESGCEAAVESALGFLAQAAVVAGQPEAVRLLGVLRDHDAGRAVFLVHQEADSERVPGQETHLVPLGEDREPPPIGAWLAAKMQVDAGLVPALGAALQDAVLVEDIGDAESVMVSLPDSLAVTRSGDVISRHWVRGGSRASSGRLEVAAAREEAERDACAADQVVLQQRRRLESQKSEEDSLRTQVAAITERVQRARSKAAAMAERSEQIRRQESALRADLKRHQQELSRAGADLTAAQERLRALQADVAEHDQRISVDGEDPSDGEPDGTVREELHTAARAARAEETEARLALRTAEERHKVAIERAGRLRREAREVRAARERAEQARVNRSRRARTAAAVLSLSETAEQMALQDLRTAQARKVELTEQGRARGQELDATRSLVRKLEAETSRITDSVHRDEVARAEQRLRIEQTAERALTDFGVDSATLVAEYGPHVPVPPSALQADGDSGSQEQEQAPHRPYDRAEQQRRLRSGERSLALLGRVNPLALEEFAALEERCAYLNEQSEDLKRSRADLMAIIKDVDERVERVFAEAFTDAAEQFELVFARLFPGGAGRLVLTDPDNLLTTGVEVEARPPGKKIKRLSLLSGGERSLTAVAFLISLFKARPSPFYVLDEVEAALDDTNLGRLIDVIDELRQSSQLIVITHQKRTMEAADALYGVSMRGDGVTQVISQRLREQVVAAPSVVDLRDSQDALTSD